MSEFHNCDDCHTPTECFQTEHKGIPVLFCEECLMTVLGEFIPEDIEEIDCSEEV